MNATLLVFLSSFLSLSCWLLSTIVLQGIEGKDMMPALLKSQYPDHTIVTFDVRTLWNNDPGDRISGVSFDSFAISSSHLHFGEFLRS